MSDPIVTGCGEPIFDWQTCSDQPSKFYSQQIVGTCPLGTHGGPFVSVAGKFTSLISQSDADSQAQSYVNNLIAIKCIALPPVVTSQTIYVGTGKPTYYQIVATYSPTSYGATGLPTGLSIDTTTGIISGTITSPTLTTYSIPISATNSDGTGHGTLTIVVRGYISISLGSSNPSGWLMFSADGRTPTATPDYFVTSLVVTGSATVTSSTSSPFENVNFTSHAGVVLKASSTISATASWPGATHRTFFISFSVPLNTQYNLNPPSAASPVTGSKTGTSDITLADGVTTGFNPEFQGDGINSLAQTLQFNATFNLG